MPELTEKYIINGFFGSIPAVELLNRLSSNAFIADSFSAQIQSW